MSNIYKKTAQLSDDGRYRYSLERWWLEPTGKTATWVMLNPSTADADIDDPTIRKCIKFSQLAECGRMIVVNLFALRATNPNELKNAEDPEGPFNVNMLEQAIDAVGPLICAWGTKGTLNNQDEMIKEIIRERMQAWGEHARPGDVYCLGTTKHGHPRHPLYVPYSQALVPFAVGLPWEEA